jgi:hypothetical protein
LEDLVRDDPKFRFARRWVLFGLDVTGEVDPEFAFGPDDFGLFFVDQLGSPAQAGGVPARAV